jgi:flagellar capping protein FliD
MSGRLELKREGLYAEFLELESVLAQMQAEQDYLTQGLSALAATAGQVRINK